MNQHGSSSLLVATTLAVLTSTAAYYLVQSNISAVRAQKHSSNESKGFFANELAAWHSRALRLNGNTTCPPGTNPVTGRCELASMSNVSYWGGETGVGTKNCGSSSMGSTRSKNCIVDWDPCQGQVKKTVSKNLSFAPNATACAWGAEGNLPHVTNSEFVTARYEDPVQSLTDTSNQPLPSNAYLCSMDFSFDHSSFNFMDGVVLTFDDIILISSDNWSYRNPYRSHNGFLLYDWSSMAGQPIATSDTTEKFRNGYMGCPNDAGGNPPLDCSTYCLGQGDLSNPLSSVCHLPQRSQTTTSGQVQFQIRNQAILNLLARYAHQQNRYDFQLITYGDHNSQDCNHGALPFSVNFTYVELAQ